MMSTEVISSDIASIHDEDLLRRMWQQTEDIGRKKEIRSHMYNLRESRMQEFHSSSDIAEETAYLRSMPASQNGSRRASLAEESLQIRDTRTPYEYAAKGIEEPPAIREETYTLCKNTDGSPCGKVQSKSLIAHESGRNGSVSDADGRSLALIEKDSYNGGGEFGTSSKMISEEKHVSGRTVKEMKTSSESASKVMSHKSSGRIEERAVSSDVKTDMSRGELISRQVERPDSNTVVIKETRQLPDGSTVISTRKEMRNESNSQASTMSSSAVAERRDMKHEERSNQIQSNRLEVSSHHTGTQHSTHPREITSRSTKTIEERGVPEPRDYENEVTSYVETKDSQYMRPESRHSEYSIAESSRSTDEAYQSQKNISKMDHGELMKYDDKSEVISRVVECPDAQTKVIKEIRKLPDGTTYTKTYTEVREVQSRGSKNKIDAQSKSQISKSQRASTEKIVRHSGTDERVAKHERQNVKSHDVHKKIEHPDEYTTITTETRTLPDGSKVTSKHTEIKGKEKITKDYAVSGDSSLEVQNIEKKSARDVVDIQASESKSQRHEHNIRSSTKDERVIKQDQQKVTSKREEVVSRTVEHPDRYTTITTETRILPDGRKVTSQHTEVQGKEKITREIGVSDISATVVDERKHVAESRKSEVIDRSITKQKSSQEHLLNKQSELISQELVSKSSRPGKKSEGLTDLRDDIRVNEIIAEKLTPTLTPYDESFSQMTKLTPSVKKDLSADVEFVNMSPEHISRIDTERTAAPKSEKLIAVPLQRDVDKLKPAHEVRPDHERIVDQVQPRHGKPETSPSEPVIPQKTRISEDISPTHHAFASSLRTDGIFVPGRKSPGSMKNLHPNIKITTRSDSPGSFKPKSQPKSPTKDSKPKMQKLISSPTKPIPDYTFSKPKQTSPPAKTYPSKTTYKPMKPLDNKKVDPQSYIKKEPRLNGIYKPTQPILRMEPKPQSKYSQDGDSSPTTTVSDLEFIKPQPSVRTTKDIYPREKLPYESIEAYEERCRKLLGMFDDADSNKLTLKSTDKSTTDFILGEKLTAERDHKVTSTDTYKKYSDDKYKSYDKDISSKTRYDRNLLDSTKLYDEKSQIVGLEEKRKSPSPLLPSQRKQSYESRDNKTTMKDSVDREYSEEILQFSKKPLSPSRSPERPYRDESTSTMFRQTDYSVSSSRVPKDESPQEKMTRSYPGSMSPQARIDSIKLDIDSREYSLGTRQYDRPRSMSPKSRDSSPRKYEPDYSTLPKSRDASPVKSDYDRKPYVPDRSRDSSPRKPDQIYSQLPAPKVRESLSKTTASAYYGSTTTSPRKTEYNTAYTPKDSTPKKPHYYGVPESPKSRESSPKKREPISRGSSPTKYKDVSPKKPENTYPGVGSPRSRDISQKKTEFTYTRSSESKAKDTSQVTVTKKTQQKTTDKTQKYQTIKSRGDSPTKDVSHEMKYRNGSPAKKTTDILSKHPVPTFSKTGTEYSHQYKYTKFPQQRSSPDGSPERDSISKENYRLSSDFSDGYSREVQFSSTHTSPERKTSPDVKTTSPYRSPTRADESVKKSYEQHSSQENRETNLFDKSYYPKSVSESFPDKSPKDKISEISKKFHIQETVERTPLKNNYTITKKTDLNAPTKKYSEIRKQESTTLKDLHDKSTSSKNKYYSVSKQDKFETRTTVGGTKPTNKSVGHVTTLYSPIKVHKDIDIKDKITTNFSTTKSTTSASATINKSLHESLRNKTEKLVRESAKKVQNRTHSAPIGRTTTTDRKYTTRTTSGNILKMNEPKKRENNKRSDIKHKQNITKYTVSPRVAKDEKYSDVKKETVRSNKTRDSLTTTSSAYSKSPKFESSPYRMEQTVTTYEFTGKSRQPSKSTKLDTTTIERPKIRKFPNLDDTVQNRDLKYDDKATKRKSLDESMTTSSEKYSFKLTGQEKDEEKRKTTFDKYSDRDLISSKTAYVSEDHLRSATDKVSQFLATADEITRPLKSDVTTSEEQEPKDYKRYNVSKMVSRFSEHPCTEELEKDTDEIQTEHQYKYRYKKDSAEDHEGHYDTLHDYEDKTHRSTISGSTVSPVPLRSTEAVKRAKQLFENIIQQESSSSKRDQTETTWKRTSPDIKLTDLGMYEKKERTSPETYYRKETDEFSNISRETGTYDKHRKTSSLKDIYDINEDELSKSSYHTKPERRPASRSEYNHEKSSRLSHHDSTQEQYTSRSVSRESEYSSVNLSRTGSPRNTVKFGVTLRRTDSDKATDHQPKSDKEPLIFPAIEDTYDIKVLEEMLDTVTSYDIRRKIRAQIRLLKRNGNRNKTSYSAPMARSPPKKSSSPQSPSSKATNYRSSSMQDNTEYQDSYCKTTTEYSKRTPLSNGRKKSPDYKRSSTKKQEGNVSSVRGESPQRSCSKYYDSSSSRSLSPDNKMSRKSLSEHLFSAKTVSSSLKERRKSSPDHQDRYSGDYDDHHYRGVKDSREDDDNHVYRTITTKEYCVLSDGEPVKQTKTHYSYVTGNSNAQTDIDKSRDKLTSKTKVERKAQTAAQKTSYDKHAKNIRNVSTKGRVGTKFVTTPRSILEPSALTSTKIVQQGTVKGFSEKSTKKTAETNINEKYTRYSKMDMEDRDPLKRLFHATSPPEGGRMKSTVHRQSGIDDDGYLVTSYTIETSGTSRGSDQKNLCEGSSILLPEHLEDIWDEQLLNSLLEQCTSYDERRRIRSRLRQVMAEQKERTAESSKSFDSSGKVISTKTVTTKTSSSVSAMTSPIKPMSPFAKFRQLDKQHSLNSPPSTPRTPGTGGVLFKFTDSELARSASSVKDRLLYWTQIKTKEYENIKIENFSTSWADGLAFCALIHHFLPDAYDYHKLNPKNRRYNFTLAFRVADEKAGIAPLLDVEDMVMMRKPDWKCVFTYVQAIYRRFKDED